MASKPAPGHKIYPYLLRNLAVVRPNQVWAMDITYIPMSRGLVYLTDLARCHAAKLWHLGQQDGSGHGSDPGNGAKQLGLGS